MEEAEITNPAWIEFIMSLKDYRKKGTGEAVKTLPPKAPSTNYNEKREGRL